MTLPTAFSLAQAGSSRTPADWLTFLCASLDAQAARAAIPEAYYNGDHPLQFATSKFKEAFGSLFGAFADNWSAIVVDAPVERLQVIGFRQGDQILNDAWRIWQRNSLDVESTVAHTEAGKAGVAYLLVDPSGDEPRISVEHATQCIVATDPGDRRSRRAALKRWQGDDGKLYATVYLPDGVYKFQSKTATIAGAGLEVEWEPRRDEPDLPNPWGVVPVVPLVNNPGLMLAAGESDLKPAIPIQNAINKLCTDLIVASEFGAFRQRVLTGVEIPRDPETGRPLGRSEIVAAMSRLWTFESTDAKVYDLNPTDLGNFVRAIDMFIAHLAAQTHTPPHYLMGQVVNASGDALKVAESGLVSKCRHKILTFSDPWEEAMALALEAAGTHVDAADVECLWADPERSSPAELVDAAVKKRTLGVPLEVIWLELGYTPAQVQEMKRLAGLPERPPAGATTANVPPVLGGTPPGGPTPATATTATQPPAPPPANQGANP